MGAFAPSLQAGVEQNPHLRVYRPVLALAHLQAGDRDAAAAELERLADFDAFPRDILWFSGICVLAEVCALLEDTGRAAELYRLLLPYRHRHVVVGMALVLRVLRALSRAAGGGAGGVGRRRGALRGRAGRQRGRRHRLDGADDPRRLDRAARGPRRHRACRGAARRRRADLAATEQVPPSPQA